MSHVVINLKTIGALLAGPTGNPLNHYEYVVGQRSIGLTDGGLYLIRPRKLGRGSIYVHESEKTLRLNFVFLTKSCEGRVHQPVPLQCCISLSPLGVVV